MTHNNINYCNLNHPSLIKNEKLKKLKKVCNAFESEILQFYIKDAFNSKNTLFPKTAGENIYKSMYQETLSKKLSGNFGYSEILFNFLKNKV